MQQTVIIKTINGKEIVVGFDHADVDPIASKREKEIVYFHPMAGEYLISNEDAEKLNVMVKDAADGVVITRDGKSIDRLELLTNEEKAAEKKELMQLTLHKAAQMKAELEIKGDAEALEKSQQWYKEETDLINLTYGEGGT